MPIPVQERLADVLRAEVAGKDLQNGDCCILVCAMRKDGSLYEIGSVSQALAYQQPEGARMAIGKIKFNR